VSAVFWSFVGKRWRWSEPQIDRGKKEKGVRIRRGVNVSEEEILILIY